MSEEGLLRTLAAIGCRPGKEYRASEEFMDLVMPYDESVWAVPVRKGLVLATSSLEPHELVKILEGKVSAYINTIVMGKRLCSCKRVMKKNCLLEVEEGKEGFCVGRVTLRIEGYLKNKGGVLKKA